MPLSLSGSLIITGSIQTVPTSGSTTTTVGPYIVSGSTTVLSGSTTVTGSSIVVGVGQVTGSLTVTGSLVVNGSGSLVIPTTSSAAPVAGQMYFNIATSKLNIYNGSTWVTASMG